MAEFKLDHTALYAKGWYEKNVDGRTLWQDLQITLGADGYNGEGMEVRDIVTVILEACQEFKTRPFQLIPVLSNIAKGNCWKFGYRTKGNMPVWLSDKEEMGLPEYDYWEAVVRYCLSEMARMNMDELGVKKLSRPDFEKVLPARLEWNETKGRIWDETFKTEEA